VALASLLAGAALVSVAAARGAREAGSTRGDLDLLRRRVALLECELALARSRKPYLIVEAPAHRLRYGLLGMTMREIPSSEIRIDGLKRGGGAVAPAPERLAGVVTLKEKEKDPRLAPLTPEQIEAGASDENVADALPPESPADFRIQLNQPVALRVEGIPEKGSVLGGAFGWWRWLGLGGGNRGARIALHLTVHVEETAAREIYRSLVPGEYMVLVAPDGFVLPDAGLESPRGIKSGRPARPPVSQPGPVPAGVPFQIPPPVDEEAADGVSPVNGSAGESGPEGEATPAVEATPEPAPPAQDTPPEEPSQGGASGPSSETGGGA
jgi:hypothetical protein